MPVAEPPWKVFLQPSNRYCFGSVSHHTVMVPESVIRISEYGNKMVLAVVDDHSLQVVFEMSRHYRKFVIENDVPHLVHDKYVSEAFSSESSRPIVKYSSTTPD